MILHPGILALLAGSGIVLAMMLAATGVGFAVMRRWDFGSSSEEQLLLERKTYLIASIVKYALGFELLAGLLFIYTVDDIHNAFVGAMCATGSLNANPVGWAALLTKIAVFFGAALWIALNAIDQRAEDFPLVKPKYTALMVVTLLVAADLVLTARYFLGLEPEVITSCCGSLFSSADTGVAGDLAALPAKSMMGTFYGSAGLFLCTALAGLFYRNASVSYAVSLFAALLFPVSLAAVVSFISLYIYELPSHHCPFDIFQKNYNFVGYPLYLGLFGGVLFGLLPGLSQPLKKRPSLAPVIERLERKWLILSILLILSFLALATWPVVFGNLTL